MSEYRRLISYMYAYDNGIKNKNVGFAKTERKGGTIRLWINLKGAYSQEESYKVHFFVRRDDAAVGINMGNMTIKNGMGQFFMAIDQTDMEVPFEDICGLYINGEPGSRMFASQWDDLPFRVDSVKELSEYNKSSADKDRAAAQKPVDRVSPLEQKAVPAETVAAPVTAGAKPAETEVNPLTAQAKPEISAAVTAELPVWERPIKMVYVADGNMAGSNMAEADIKISNVPETEGTVLQPLHASEDSKAVVKAHSEIDMLFDGKEPVLAFSEDEIYDCVDIGLDELPKIKGAESSLVNNSFVNHGYFNFHHLLLGKKDGNILVVGVPGVYNRREKITANMFGFEKFKFSMRSDVCMNHFGYWYKEYQF